MAKKIFREKSIDRIDSPQQLNDYIRVASPGVYLTLGAALIFLICFGVWAGTATLDITVEARGVADGDIIYCYLGEDDIAYVEEGMEVRTGSASGRVTSVAEVPEDYEAMAETLGGESIVHALRIEEGEWRYLVEISGEAGDEGFTDVSIVTDSVSPLAYVF